MLAHAGTPDEFVAEVFFVLAGASGWVAVTRLRGRAFLGIPLAGAWGLAAVSALAIAGGIVVPSWMRPTYSAIRPRSTATLSIVRPSPGQVEHGNTMRVVLDLGGGRITPLTTTRLTPSTGHIHVYVDGRLVSMTTTTDGLVDISGLADGRHTLQAEFVAADHGPFEPPVVASATFEKAS
jgi:hypothetical protein